MQMWPVLDHLGRLHIGPWMFVWRKREEIFWSPVHHDAKAVHRIGRLFIFRY